MNSHGHHQPPDRLKPGDILIARDSDTGYTLSVVPGEAQLRHPTYKLALSKARAWALRHNVAVWFTQDGERFVKLGRSDKGAGTDPQIPDTGIAGWLRLIRAEYLEIPGLQLTNQQVQRLWGLDPLMCEALLTALVDAGFLKRTLRDGFIRADQG